MTIRVHAKLKNSKLGLTLKIWKSEKNGEMAGICFSFYPDIWLQMTNNNLIKSELVIELVFAKILLKQTRDSTFPYFRFKNKIFF